MGLVLHTNCFGQLFLDDLFEVIRMSSTSNQIPDYVSCIRINGAPILPPVMTPERRHEMVKYKELAIAVENRLKLQEMKHKKSTGSTDDTEFFKKLDFPPAVSSHINETFDNNYSDIPQKLISSHTPSINLNLQTVQHTNVTGLTSNSVNKSGDDTFIQPSDDSVVYDDPLEQYLDALDHEPLTSYRALRENSFVIDESQDPIKECATGEQIDCQQEISVTRVETPSKDSASGTNLHEIECIAHVSDSDKAEPKLIRQNSYVIDTPSPLLLAYIENKTCEAVINTINRTSHERRRRSCWDLVHAKEKWSSFETDIDVTMSPIKNQVTPKPFKRKQNNCSSMPSSVSPSPTKLMFESGTAELKRNTPCKNHQTRNSIKGNAISKNTKLINRKSLSTEKLSTEKNGKLVHKPNTSNIGKNTINIAAKQRNVCSSDGRGGDTPVGSSRADGDTCQLSPLVNTTSWCENASAGDLDSFERDEKMKSLYMAIRNDHSRQMAKLMIRQKKEQETLIRRFNDQQTILMNQLKQNCKITSPQTVQTLQTVESQHVSTDLSCTRIRSVNYVAATNASTVDITQSTPTNELIRNSDLVLQECEKLLNKKGQISAQSCILSENTSSSQTLDYPGSSSAALTDLASPINGTMDSVAYLDVSIIQKNTTPVQERLISNDNQAWLQQCLPMNYVQAEDMRNANVPQEPNENSDRFIPHESSPDPKVVNAVIVLQAATRGFLIRRLLSTERVQMLIQTVRDTLLCALQLHKEDNENIQPADVELHRGLINQLTAACYAIHDVFFDTPLDEQMSIISIDRQRLKERLMRPLSARNSSSLSVTTQKSIERKRFKSPAHALGNESFSRSIKSAGETRERTTSFTSGTLTDLSIASPIQQNIAIRRSASHNFNKKPWR